ncbi:hypothetical protein KP509_32G062800 [Ceratopteris richardii]|uniref:Uncharacterized protein n=1 Tax=Ceratopteris richardii TaxID=49495 RepID=A0A8T2QVK8_CERRI|nr:hypothetical protein KP509_32G062800 [Ceratopteris richardii]
MAAAVLFTSKTGVKELVVLIYAAMISSIPSDVTGNRNRHMLWKPNDRVFSAGPRNPPTSIFSEECPGITCPRFGCSQFVYGSCKQNPAGKAIPCACCGIKCLTGVSGCSIHTQTKSYPCGF